MPRKKNIKIYIYNFLLYNVKKRKAVKKMKIGFIGCGNMANAIINGIIGAKVFEKNDIFASDIEQNKLTQFCDDAEIHAADNSAIATKCDIILLAVKPQKFPEVLPKIANELNDNQLIISIAAGKKIAFIESCIGSHKIIRIMPNLNATIQQSVSALCANSNCTQEDIAITKKIFESIGVVFELEEERFSAFSAVACCSPAFSFMYIDALAKAGIACGLEEGCAYAAAAASVIGSAEMLKQSTDTPQELITKVCSPGGTTIEGVKVLKKKGLSETIAAAVNASYEKDKTL